MSLKVLLLRKDLEAAKAELEKARNKMEGIKARSAEAARTIEELTEESTAEERSAVEEEVNAVEAERVQTQEEINDLSSRVADIESEIAAKEANQDPQPAPEPPAEPADPEPADNQRGERIIMSRRAFHGMNEAEVRTMLAREDVQTFLTNVRTAIREKRAVTGAQLLIPKVFLGLIKENIDKSSKLYKYVNVRTIGGNGEAVIMGTINEAVWTDCCGILNELSLNFNDVTVGCWKVGGYFDICNATLEDSDIDLAEELIRALGQAIGFALDKAILFGLGTRMPEGILTRLLQTSEPADYPATARPWVDLHTTNILTLDDDLTGVAFFQAFLAAAGAAKNKYSTGAKTWAMNETTYNYLVSQGMSVNANGGLVSAINGTLPVIGGTVEILEFVPDNMIIGGYMDLYLLADRANVKIAQSEHAMFIQDRTVFKGTARYDGKSAIAEGFVAIGINGVTPSASGITFAPDIANNPESE